MEEKTFLERKKKAIGLIHRIYLTQIKNARIHTASTKTKSEVRGGGRKPWKQKGTGNARAGSSRSPLWVGGGVIFGPKPRTVSKKINKKERRLGILSAFYLKKNQQTFIGEERFQEFKEQKTKKILLMIQELGLTLDKKILFVLSNSNKVFWLAARNLENVEVTTVNSLNVKQLLTNHHIILSKSSIDVIHDIYGKQYA